MNDSKTNFRKSKIIFGNYKGNKDNKERKKGKIMMLKFQIFVWLLQKLCRITFLQTFPLKQIICKREITETSLVINFPAIFSSFAIFPTFFFLSLFSRHFFPLSLFSHHFFPLRYFPAICFILTSTGAICPLH